MKKTFPLIFLLFTLCNSIFGQQVSRPKISFRAGTVLTEQHITYLNSVNTQIAPPKKKNAKSIHEPLFNFQSNHKLTEQEAVQIYSQLKRYGFADERCELYCCDNGYACNPNSPPPGCGTCSCCDISIVEDIPQTQSIMVVDSNEFKKVIGLKKIKNDTTYFLNPYFKELKRNPDLILYEHEDKKGWKVVYDDGRDMTNIAPSSQASSLEIMKNGWVILYSKSHYRGSELYIKGPYYIPELRNIEKINNPGVTGNWNDEIASFRFVSSRPSGGDGTYVNDDQTSIPSVSSCPLNYRLANIDGYTISNEADGLTYFYIYNLGCTLNMGGIKTSDIKSITKTGIKCNGQDVSRIFFCYPIGE